LNEAKAYIQDLEKKVRAYEGEKIEFQRQKSELIESQYDY
jgi:hypothetical protein